MTARLAKQTKVSSVAANTMPFHFRERKPDKFNAERERAKAA
jgi:hypothetical protein